MLREPVGGQPSDGVERARLGEKVVGAVDGQELMRTADPSPRESGHDGVLSRERQQTIGQLPARIATIQKPHARSLVPSFRRSIRSYPHCTREFPRSGLSRGRTRGRERDRPGCIAFTLMPGEAQTGLPRLADGDPATAAAEGSSLDIVSHYFDTAPAACPRRPAPSDSCPCSTSRNPTGRCASRSRLARGGGSRGP